MEGDRNRFCQVINNLLSNAFKFTTKGSLRVIVDRYVSSNKIVVKVKDSGIGIHPDMLPKLITKFATKSDTGGTGLGLFISKSIIEKHGSQIHTVVSGTGTGPSDPNQGEVFSSGLIAPGATFTQTFVQSDIIPYYCSLHPQMVGTIFVS